MANKKLPEGFAKNEFGVWAKQRQQSNPKAWETALAQKRQMSPPPELSFQADAKQLESLLKLPGLFVPDGKAAGGVVIKQAKNPYPLGSLGYVGEVVEVAAGKETYSGGALVLPFTPALLGTVRRETLALFRWDKTLKSFQLVPVSGVGKDADYVWGRITAPGLYVIIGLQSDPLLLKMLHVTTELSELLGGMKSKSRAELLLSLCTLLNNEELRRASTNSQTLERLFQNGWNPSSAYWVTETPKAKSKSRRKKDVSPLGGDPIELCPPMPFEGWFERPLFHHDWPGFPGGYLFDPGWSSAGPTNIAGHSTEVVVDPTNHNRIYTATADGGVWCLDNVTFYPTRRWRPLTDQENTLSIQAMAVAPSNGSIIYYGDGLNRLMRSDNRGMTWRRASMTDHGAINRIVVHPTEPNLVYVASETGLWRSRDGGATWDSNGSYMTMYDGAITDLKMDYQSAATLFIGVRGIGLLKSSTSGRRFDVVLPWSRAASPTGSEIRIALGRQGTTSTRAVVARFDQEVFVNRGGGRPGTTFTSRGQIGGNGYSGWCFAIGVDPFDDNVILAGSQDLYRATNGFDLAAPANWMQVAGYNGVAHPDQWHVEFDAAQRGLVYLANDGGVYRSIDSGATWTDLNQSLITAQIYDTGVSGNNAMAGMYHQGIVASTNLGSRGWSAIEGGSWEFSNVYGDPRRPYYFYVISGVLHRRRWPNTGGPDFDINFGNFNVTSVAVDPRSTSDTLLAGSSNPGAVMRALNGSNRAPTWTQEPGISLTAGSTIASVAFAPSEPGRAYAISSDGRVFTKADVNAGDAWTQTGQWSVSGVVQLMVNSLHSDRLYAINGNSIARSPDSGRTWIPIPGSGADMLPASPFKAIVVPPDDGAVIYLAADIGVFVTSDEGVTWYNYDSSTTSTSVLPNARIEYLFWHRGRLYAALSGRGLWWR
ncbi:MAG: hypothetical protein QOF02_2216 [Blastocatellia bacterium]|nr:hypothetical protein [Blastocatellia bacterium]